MNSTNITTPIKMKSIQTPPKAPVKRIVKRPRITEEPSAEKISIVISSEDELPEVKIEPQSVLRSSKVISLS